MTDSGTRVKTIVAFAAVYLIWGSTYLGIRLAVQTMPPFLMAGSRFFVAGLLLAGWCKWRKEPALSAIEVWQAVGTGVFMFVGGNGLVSWAEQRIPSGLAALLVATEPMWLAILLCFGGRGVRPGPMTVGAIVLGLTGVGLLVMHGGDASGFDALGIGAVLLATVCWTVGSIYAFRIAPVKSASRQLMTQMVSSGLFMALIGLGMGEGGQMHLAAVSRTSLVAFGYLVVFGSIGAYGAYSYLLRVTTPTKAATYAYVNPAVAVFLGWMFQGEPLGGREVAATAVIVGAVVLLARSSTAASAEAELAPPPRLLLPEDEPEWCSASVA